MKTPADKSTYKIYAHYLPDYFFRFPFLITPVRWFHYLMHNRNRLVMRTLKRQIQEKGEKLKVLDAGCGEGNYLIPLANRFKKASFKGLDFNPRLVHFVNAYAEKYHLNVQAEVADLNAINLDSKFDLILCVAVLQMMKDEDRILQAFHQALTDNGKLVINVPIDHNPVFAFNTQFKMNYDVLQASEKKRYSVEQIQAILTKNGFKVDAFKATNGALGTAGNELLNLGLDLLQNLKGILKVLFLPVFVVVFLPVILGLNVLNGLSPKKKMSGVVVLATKSLSGK